MRIDVLKSREMLATIYAIRSVDKSIQKQIRQNTQRVAAPEWKKALAERANSRLEHRVLVDTAVTSVSNQNLRMQSAGKGKPLRGGLNPKTQYAPVEFGYNAKGKSYMRRSKKGGKHPVTRVMGTQFKPARRKGYVFYPAAENMVPRMASLFVQTTVRTIAEALEGKES
ncbi:hypothetical protein [Microbacterium hominis]|uniref:hypothetical protein n=1 Tax=Microbacterium hominis TaxID=162426 RepID=UPI0012E089AB|nr:hypothetical protein [Microbacterium hominis]